MHCEHVKPRDSLPPKPDQRNEHRGTSWNSGWSDDEVRYADTESLRRATEAQRGCVARLAIGPQQASRDKAP